MCVREAKARIKDIAYAHTCIVPACVHACILACVSHHPCHSLTLHPGCVSVLLSRGFSCGSPLTVCPFAAFHSKGVASANKDDSRCFSFVRMQSVLMLPGCCHSCTPIAHAAPVSMFRNSNNMKRTYEMCPKFTLTYIKNMHNKCGREYMRTRAVYMCTRETQR